MKQYKITGMSCAACVARVEKAVSKVDGVQSCCVNLLTNSMTVEGEALDKDIIKAVKDAGYGVANTDAKSQKEKDKDDTSDEEFKALRRRLISSLGFLLVLMYFSMGHMMWGFWVPEFFHRNPLANGLLQLLLTIAIMIINRQFFVKGFKGLMHKATNMDTLVALGSSAAFVYSVYALFAMSDLYVTGDIAKAVEYMDEFYFESAAMILTLITVGKMLEAKSKGKTTNALKSLMELAPDEANVIRAGEEIRLPVEEIIIGDIVLIRPGEKIPVDGVVIEGNSAVNEAALTGESIPVDKEAGDKVSTATINQSGYLKCKVTNVGEDTALSKIIKLVSDASATKAPIARIADKVSGIFVPTVIIIALITTVLWLLAGKTIGFALARGICVLVISCPCALGLATPVAIMVGSGVGAKNGILFKTASAIEEAGKVNIIALDKTGTITKGEPAVKDVIPAGKVSEEIFLSYCGSLESKSEHPLGKAVYGYAKENKIPLMEINNFITVTGNGLKATVGGKIIAGGNLKYIKTLGAIPKEYIKLGDKLSKEGKTVLYFLMDSEFMGIISLADEIKEDSPKAIKQLKNMGIKVVMLTGDNEETANAIGKKIAADEIIAGVSPGDKEAVVRKLKEQGKVAMVGDGINDAPALTSANVGIAIGAGTDIAIDAADVVLMKSNLTDVAAAIRLSRKTLKNIKENLFWAFIYNIIGIPLAAGVYYGAFGWKLNPMFAAAAMSMSSVCVVTNALRLNFVKIYNTKGDYKVKNKKEKEVRKMTKTMEIEGMMCGHCEAAVKKALEALDGVDSAAVSHENNNAIVTLNAAVSDDILRKAVEDKDYKVISIK